MGFHLLNVWISIRPQTLRLHLFSHFGRKPNWNRRNFLWRLCKFSSSCHFLFFSFFSSYRLAPGTVWPSASPRCLSRCSYPWALNRLSPSDPITRLGRYLQSRGGTSQLLLAHRSVSSSSPPVFVILYRSVAHNSLFRPSQAGEVHGFTVDAAARFAAIDIR